LVNIGRGTSGKKDEPQTQPKVLICVRLACGERTLPNYDAEYMVHDRLVKMLNRISRKFVLTGATGSEMRIPPSAGSRRSWAG
jgi:hypothetical protein